MLNKKALAASVSAPPAEYVEDVFSTYLYTGNDTGQTITNNIDLSGEGGMVWIKDRTQVSTARIVDTVRGTTNGLIPSTTGSTTVSNSVTNFTSTGFTVGNNLNVNDSNGNFCSWTFRKAPKFFDVVTYTGNGSAPRDIAHNLGSSPGFIIIKRTNSTGDWWCWHRSIANKNIYLNYTDAADSGANPMISAVSSTNFTLATNQNATMNINGATYVAYLFAHDAGGFGAAGTDNIISCGSFTANGSGDATVELGYEPQLVLLKASSVSDGWLLMDTMRRFCRRGADPLYPDLSSAESVYFNGEGTFTPTATGFSTNDLAANVTYIYMAIRRPMKTPTSGTEVFSPIASAASTGTKLTTNFPIDLQISNYRPYASNPAYFVDRLRGASSTDTDGGIALTSTSTAAEVTSPALARFWDNTGFKMSGYYGGADDIFWNFRRATGFFDIVCYTGTGSARTVTHNLGVAPELMIIKRRNTTAHWMVYAQPLGNTSRLLLSSSNGESTGQTTVWNSTSPTSSVFSLGTSTDVNASGSTYVAYLFATLNGISKVGSYTGNGSNQTINCGFTAGARFVMIKRTDSTGDWCVFDTARGIVSGNDPFLQLNTTDAEVTGEDAVDPTNSGFIVNETTEALNTNNATYIYLAIA